MLILQAIHGHAAMDVPEILELTADLDSITVTWTGDDDPDGYYVYWKTQEETSYTRASVTDSPGVEDETYVIEGLESGTTYDVAVSAYEIRFSSDGEEQEEETERSEEEAITTESDTTAPAVPSGFGVTDPEEITQNEVPLQWDANSESDMDVYRIAYGTTSGSYDGSKDVPAEEGTQTTVKDLYSETRYFFAIRAVDESGNESGAADELIVDTRDDELPPFVPAVVSALMSDAREVTVTLESNNENMADYAGIVIHYGMTSGSYERSADIGKSKTHVVSELPEDTTWYFAASAYDVSGNKSGLSGETAVTIEETRGAVSGQDADFKSGCFISSLFDSAETESREFNNKTGISAGYLLTADSEFEDIYGNDTFPVFVFYDRKLSRSFSADFKAGYMEEKGRMKTVSDAPTRIKTTFTAIPVSASVNYNFPVAKSIWGFFGAGPDYWHIREDPEISGPPGEVSEWVGGWHGRTGLWLYNQDPEFSQWGALLECGYYRIDRFGGNSFDPGGWIFSLGLFYGF
ncbi:MAG: fibronectin type III domain-containing protein [Desulfobacterales bacterium]